MNPIGKSIDSTRPATFINCNAIAHVGGMFKLILGEYYIDKGPEPRFVAVLHAQDLFALADAINKLRPAKEIVDFIEDGLSQAKEVSDTPTPNHKPNENFP